MIEVVFVVEIEAEAVVNLMNNINQELHIEVLFNAIDANNLGINKPIVGQSNKVIKRIYVDFVEAYDAKISFMAHISNTQSSKDVWFIDNGCFNHMTSTRSLFEELDESHLSDVQLGDDKQIQIKGRGTVAI
ncbi:hypothetical protein K1719_040957 [Acacia pycnantha]|nr:hypothetical protein K1719_040957 [Acacia pycnantha]